MEAVVSVTHSSGGYTLFINANTVPLGRILEELAEQCTITVAIYERALLFRPISVSFQGVSIEEGIKKLVKAAGITNHFITYRNNAKNGSEVSEFTLLSSSGKTEGIALTTGTGDRETGKEDTIPVDGDVPPEDTAREKIESFKGRYKWEDGETRELAEYLLTVMPDPVRGTGLDELTEALDRRITEGDKDTVDEKLLYQAIGDTVPSPYSALHDGVH